MVSPYLPIIVGNVRNHNLKEYWDAGLSRIWEIPIIEKLASQIISTIDFGRKKENGTPNVWFEHDITLDLIDNNLMKGE